MKKLILILIVSLFALNVSAQQNDNYTFKIVGVDDLSSSKMPIDIMRKSFLINPVFNDLTDSFIVPSTQFLSQSELSSKLSYYGYTVIEFKNPKNIELEEK